MHTAQEIKALCKKYQFWPSKREGQNFLVEPHFAELLVDALDVSPGDLVVEVGAGLGALTEQLLGAGVELILVEKDRRLFRALKDRFKKHPQVKQMVLSDVLDLSIRDLTLKSVTVAGNLPYSISGPFLEWLARQSKQIQTAVLTLQREVAERAAADGGSKSFGSVSVLVQSCFETQILTKVSPKAFYPQPKITSSILKLTSRKQPLVKPSELKSVTEVVRCLFQRRRKQILNGLQHPQLGFTSKQSRSILKQIGLEPTLRVEQILTRDLVQLSRIALLELGITTDNRRKS